MYLYSPRREVKRDTEVNDALRSKLTQFYRTPFLPSSFYFSLRRLLDRNGRNEKQKNSLLHRVKKRSAFVYRFIFRFTAQLYAEREHFAAKIVTIISNCTIVE